MVFILRTNGECLPFWWLTNWINKLKLRSVGETSVLSTFYCRTSKKNQRRLWLCINTDWKESLLLQKYMGYIIIMYSYHFLLWWHRIWQCDQSCTATYKKATVGSSVRWHTWILGDIWNFKRMKTTTTTFFLACVLPRPQTHVMSSMMSLRKYRPHSPPRVKCGKSGEASLSRKAVAKCWEAVNRGLNALVSGRAQGSGTETKHLKMFFFMYINNIWQDFVLGMDLLSCNGWYYFN